MIDLHRKIRLLRETRNLKQAYLASTLGISQRAYSDLETGKTEITITKLNKIAGAFNMLPGEIIDKPIAELLLPVLSDLE